MRRFVALAEARILAGSGLAIAEPTFDNATLVCCAGEADRDA